MVASPRTCATRGLWQWMRASCRGAKRDAFPGGKRSTDEHAFLKTFANAEGISVDWRVGWEKKKPPAQVPPSSSSVGETPRDGLWGIWKWIAELGSRLKCCASERRSFICVCVGLASCACVCVCVCRWSHSSCVKSPVHPLTPIWPKNNTPRQSKSDDLGFWTLLFNGFPKVNPVTFRKNILFSSCFGFSKCSAASDLQICPLNLPQVIKSVTLWCLKGHYVVMENTFKLRIRY